MWTCCRIRCFWMRQMNENENLPPDKQMVRVSTSYRNWVRMKCFDENLWILINEKCAFGMWAYVVFVWMVAFYQTEANNRRKAYNHVSNILSNSVIIHLRILPTLHWMNQSTHFAINYFKIFIFVSNKIISCGEPMG